MKGQDARPAAMLEEIIVAEAIPQQRQVQQSHVHNASYADDGSRRADVSLRNIGGEKMPSGEGSQGHHSQRPKSPDYLDLNTARSPRPARETATSPCRKALASKKSSRRMASPTSPSSNEEDFKFGDDLEEEAAPSKPFWRKWKFYRTSFVLLVRQDALLQAIDVQTWCSVCVGMQLGILTFTELPQSRTSMEKKNFAFIVAGVLLRVFNRHSSGSKIAQPRNSWDRFRADVQNFELWRWFFFFGGIAPIWWVGDFVVRLLVFLVESAFLNTRNVMYFLVAVRKPVGHFIRAVLLMPLYVPLFSPKAYSSATASHVYIIVLKAIACLILFTFANVLSTLLAKMMASHFHKATHFHKMQEAIRKEYYLSVLSAPRPCRAGKMMAFSSDVDLAKLGRSGSSGSDTDGQQRKPAAFSSQLYNTLVAQVAAKVLPGGAGRASSAPLNVGPQQPEPKLSTAAKHLQQSNTELSNSMVLPPMPPVRTPHVLVSPARPPAGPQVAPEDRLATHSQPGHVEGDCGTTGMARESLTDPAAANYYSAGNAQRVCAARDKTRRKLTGSHSRNPSDTNPETPGADDLLRELPHFPHQSRRWSTTSSPFRREPEGSSTSREKLLSKESGLGKWGSMGTKEKFDAGHLMAEVIENSAEPPDLREGDRDGHNIAARLHAVEKHLRKNPLQGGTFYDKLQRSTSKKGFGEAVEKQAKRAAFYIYWNVQPDSARSYIIAEDFEELLPLEQSHDAFAILDQDGNGRLTPKELCLAVTQIYKERANLAVQLKDTKSVVGRLKFVISIVLHCIFIFFYLVIYNVDIQKVWLLFSSVVLAFAFVFGNSIRQLYEAVIFLFVIHPYDVGDWLMIGQIQYQVEEISLAVTTLRGADMIRQYYPNTQMTGAAIVNISRSENKFDSFTVPVATSTPTHILEEVAKRVDGFLRANRNEYTGSRECVYKDVQDVWPVRTIIFIAWQYTHTGADVGRTLKARSGVIKAVHDALHELGVYMPANRDNHPSAAPEH